MISTYSSIPKEYAIDQTIAHTNYLIDGQIGTWDGNSAEVYSSIQTENERVSTVQRCWVLFPTWMKKLP